MSQKPERFALYEFTLKGKTQPLPLRERPLEEIHADKYIRAKILKRMGYKPEEIGIFAIKLVKYIETL